MTDGQENASVSQRSTTAGCIAGEPLHEADILWLLDGYWKVIGWWLEHYSFMNEAPSNDLRTTIERPSNNYLIIREWLRDRFKKINGHFAR